MAAAHADAAEPQDLVDQMLRYIDQHYMKNIGLNQIAGELNVTPSYLSALFHKKTGTTFIKYLTRLRILKAKELLLGTNLQIRQIAEQVGYHSTRYFTRLFVDMVGEFPSDFRKKTRGEEHVST
jgi:two-component system response regulator YesN